MKQSVLLQREGDVKNGLSCKHKEYDSKPVFVGNLLWFYS